MRVVEIVIASRIPPRPYSTEACHSGLHVWVNKSCTVGRLMMAVTKIATHQQSGSDLGLRRGWAHQTSVSWPEEVQGPRVYFGALGLIGIWAPRVLM